MSQSLTDLTQALSDALSDIRSAEYAGKAESDDLVEWIAHLDETDGYIMGLAIRSLQGVVCKLGDIPSEATLLKLDRTLEDLRSTVSGGDAAVWEQCRLYFKKLLALRNLLQQYTEGYFRESSAPSSAEGFHQDFCSFTKHD